MNSPLFGSGRGRGYEKIDSLSPDETTQSGVARKNGREKWFVALVVGFGLLFVMAGVYYWSPFSTKSPEKPESDHASSRYKYNDSMKQKLLDNSYDETNLYYDDQLIDHMNKNYAENDIDSDTDDDNGRYSQLFQKKSRYWKGPGYPIFMIMGGESPLELPMLYPYVSDYLAEEFGAFVVIPEHRFYGVSQPVSNPTVEELIRYLTPDQALEDAINLLKWMREELGCSTNPSSDEYCPVITIGASYPGFLSFMMRFRFPDVVDIGYASSAPLDLYSQLVDSNAYYDKVTEVAEIASPGCSDALRSTLYSARSDLLSNYKSPIDAAKATGFCPKTFPKYIKSVPEFISETITYLVPAIFADYNMAYYPPGPQQPLKQVCDLFLESSNTTEAPIDRLARFFRLRGKFEYGAPDDGPDACFDLSLELPAGPHARIRGSDNSGSGGGFTGEIWEFQCCKDLIIRAGYSKQSMFLPRPFNYTWHKDHCNERFPGVPVKPFRMVHQWGFNDLGHTSRVLFANGLRDGWSTSSILETDNPKLEVINFPNGAHHSELSGIYPNPKHTEDIKAGHALIKNIVGSWLDEIYSQSG